MISSLLIANRGEIACRIIRTARAMSIRTIAVYSDADAKALHVRSADAAVHIGPSPAAESYLASEKIIAAAKDAGADAIHPGYGFLSENADFAQAVIEAGLIWVGPKPESIRAMGLKDAAKTLMNKAGVPTTPGYIGDNQEPDFLAQQAEKIGYPVLIKAVAGGGGKGMRKVDAAGDFADSLASCQREAKASFGNDIVLIEKWIESPRHIEVQVFGDAQGNIVHLFERDCSLQRRHQKVIEEAPAPGMDEATREAVCGAAVKAARAVNYEGAGTIEFIADGSGKLDADKIWFMEMNTRLQVEHPVTEEITGVDLVEWQLRIASGEPLPMRQEELSIDGHAIEARLYAEDPASGFLPSTGRLDLFYLGDDFGPGRIETGVQQGDAISPFYDPMIAKLVAHGDTRDDARFDLMEMLTTAYSAPVRTNGGFLHACLSDADFAQAKLTTGFIEQKGDALLPPPLPSDDALTKAASYLVDEQSLRRGKQDPLVHISPAFRLNAGSKNTVPFSVGGERMTGNYITDMAAAYELDGQVILADADGGIIAEHGHSYTISLAPPHAAGGAAASDGAILAPMPGRVITVDVAQGGAVAKGDKLMTLEAMKMEHVMTAPFDGVVAQLSVEAGAQVDVEAVLAIVEAAEK